MMKKHSFTQFRPSALRVAGLLMMTAGLVIIFSFNLRNGYSSEQNDRQEMSSEVSIISEYEEKTETAREVSAKGLPYLLLGGILIMGGIPMFFVPYTDKGIWLRRKKERKKKEEPVESDPEFDYPDDDYDFIIRRETYELLHKEKLEKVRKKHDKQ